MTDVNLINFGIIKSALSLPTKAINSVESIHNKAKSIAHAAGTITGGATTIGSIASAVNPNITNKITSPIKKIPKPVKIGAVIGAAALSNKNNNLER